MKGTASLIGVLSALVGLLSCLPRMMAGFATRAVSNPVRRRAALNRFLNNHGAKVDLIDTRPRSASPFTKQSHEPDMPAVSAHIVDAIGSGCGVDPEMMVVLHRQTVDWLSSPLVGVHEIESVRSVAKNLNEMMQVGLEY